jgi:hypothetical protein
LLFWSSAGHLQYFIVSQIIAWVAVLFLDTREIGISCALVGTIHLLQTVSAYHFVRCYGERNKAGYTTDCIWYNGLMMTGFYAIFLTSLSWPHLGN